MCEMLHKLIILHLYPDGNENSRMSFNCFSREQIKSLEVTMEHMLSSLYSVLGSCCSFSFFIYENHSRGILYCFVFLKKMYYSALCHAS